MKCLVLMSLVLNTFLLKINAQDDKSQLHQKRHNVTEPETTNLNLSAQSSTDTSFLSKIQKNGENNFEGFISVPNFSSGQINKAFKSFETRLKSNQTNPRLNLIIDEDDTEKEKFESGLAESTGAESNENVSVVNIDFKNDGIQDVGIQSNEKAQIQNKTDIEDSSQNESIHSSNPYNNNVSTTENPNFTIILQDPIKSFDRGYFEVVVPQTEIKNDSEIRSILESVRDSVNEASNLGKENIVRSDNVALLNTNSIDRADRVLSNKNSTHRVKSSRKVNYGKRYSYNSYNRNKKKTRKRRKNKRPIDNHQINDELKSGNNTFVSMPAHLKQDRRMVNEDFSHQFGLRIPADSKQSHDFPYKFEPIEQYIPSNNSRLDVNKSLFEPRHDAVSRSFSYQEPHSYRGQSNPSNYIPGQSISSQFFHRKNEYGPVTFGIDHSAHTNVEHEDKSITLTKEIPVSYTVKIEKPVPYPVYVKIPYDKPYPVIVPKPYKVVHEVLQPYHVYIKVPKPYEVIEHVPTPVKVPVDRPYPVPVPKPYHVSVEKKVPVVVEKKVPYPVHVPVDRPYPVHITIPKHVPYTVEKKYPVQVKVPVDKPYPVYIPKPYPVHVTKPVPHTVEKHVPYPVKVAVHYPVKVPVPYPVVKHVPVYEHEPDTHPQHY